MKNSILTILIFLALIILSIFIVISLDSPKESKEDFAKVTFITNGGSSTTFICEIADSPEKRAEGLMFRKDLPESEGMLFIFDEAKNVCFWMKDTLMPLDIIFIAENNSVVNVEEAAVQLNVSDDKLIRYCSAAPIKWVVEINSGLSEKFDINKGAVVDIKYE